MSSARTTAAFALGLAGLAAQVLLFREALVRAGGDELALGTLLATWLAAGAAGAFLSRWPRRRAPWLVLAGLGVLGAALVGGMVAWRAGPALGGALPGERLGIAVLGLQALVWNGPAAAAAAWLLGRLAEAGGRRAPSLLAWEAVGAAVAGLLLALEPVLRIASTAGNLDTRHGRYEVVERGAERWLRWNGRDAWILAGGTRECRVPLAVLLLQPPTASTVLLAGDPDLLPLALTCGPRRIDLLLPDAALGPWLRERAGPDLAAALDDPRVRLCAGDLRAWLRGPEPRYGAIWLGGGDPDRGDAARRVSVEGMRALREHLADEGALGLRLGAVDGVRGSLGMQRAALLAAGCADAGLEPAALPDGTLLAVASPGRWRLDPDELRRDAELRGLAGVRSLAAAWSTLLAPASVEALNRALRPELEDEDPLAVLLSERPLRPGTWPPFSAGERHTDRRPRARTLSARILESHARGGRPDLLEGLGRAGGGGLFALCLAGLLGLARVTSLRGPRGAMTTALSLASSSLAGSAALVLLFERYQAHTGALFADLGWLSGAFLLGFATGSRAHRLARGWRADVLMGLALGALLAWAAGSDPSAAGAGICALLLGLGVGAPVGGAASAGRPAWAWGLDLLGAAPGAWLASVALLPQAGWLGCLAVLGGLKTAPLFLRLASARSRAGAADGGSSV